MTKSFKSEEDFHLKRNDVLILRKKAINRLDYIAAVACSILNINYESEGVYITTEQILDIESYDPDEKEESDGFIGFNLGICNLPKSLEFKDKYGNIMDIQNSIPRRWLWEEFEEELKNGLYIHRDEQLEVLKKELSDFELKFSKLNISDDDKDILGITAKLKELKNSVDYYHY